MSQCRPLWYTIIIYNHYRTLGYASQTDAKHCEPRIQSSLARKISWGPDIQYMQPAKSKGLKNESAKTWAESKARSLKLTWELQIVKVITFRGPTWLNKSQERNIDPDVFPMFLSITTVPKHSFCSPSLTLRSWRTRLGASPGAGHPNETCTHPKLDGKILRL